ncbi:MAG: BLUF domain-containing protein [Ardenticatenaceae bacterium]|nr:BLUF domain-containing protein [Ardenticatenaceae bacterium]
MLTNAARQSAKPASSHFYRVLNDYQWYNLTWSNHKIKETIQVLSIIYASSSIELLTDEQLVAILESSQRNNERLGITGMLLYHDGNFIQAIEGPDEAVLELYEKVKNDKRHRDVTLLGKDPITERQFPTWTMGFKNLNQLSPEDRVRFNQFLVDDLTPEYFQSRPTRAYILLMSFKETIR